MHLKTIIRSFRLRTLPLSMSGIVLGSGMSYSLVEDKKYFFIVFCLAIITTLCLQILSNLSNELGDALKGTDADQHARAAYGMQAGEITANQMKMLIGIFVALSIIFGSALVWYSFSTLADWRALLFLCFGLLAILGAMTYTLGKHNYGYRGLGDLGVFLFFGLMSVMGSFYLQAKTMTVEVVVAAVAIAMPIVGVLNLNNIRDMDNDIAHGKRTLAGKLGKTGAKIYHTVLLVTCFALFVYLKRYYTLFVLPVMVWHLIYIFTHQEAELDKQMPVLMFSTIAIAFLACI